VSTSPVNPHVQDNGGGSVYVAWPAFVGITPASYNVYVNGVLNQNVVAPTRSATISGLQDATYSQSAVAPTPNNSARPQSMPPVGVVTDALTYTLQITAVVAGVEVAQSVPKKVTVQPNSVMLTTPMKRNIPFPLTGNTEMAWQ
jgi:hypothetical protein